jgi:4-azaleucine resistance transporter AzlC
MKRHNHTNIAGSTNIRELTRGLHTQLPLALGIVPFHAVLGAFMVNGGISPFQTIAFSLLVYAGASQYVAAAMIFEGAPPLMTVFVILVVNLRFLLYSASLAPRWRDFPRYWKMLLAWHLSDPIFALADARYQDENESQENAHFYVMGMGVGQWTTMVLSTLMGAVLGPVLPQSLNLEFALPLLFISLLVPALTGWPAWVAAGVAACLAIALNQLPYKIGLLLAALGGIAAGYVMETLMDRRG